MAEALDSIELGVVVLDIDCRIVFVNDRFTRMFELDGEICHAGSNFVDIIWILSDRGEFGQGEVDSIVAERVAPLRNREKIRLTRRRVGGQMIAETGAPLAGGGYVYSFSDVTADIQNAERLNAAGKATVLALADLAEFRDTETGDHVVRVARLTHEIARMMAEEGVYAGKISRDILDHIAVASILHDVGKVAISDEILRKPAALTPEERATMQVHSEAGAAILAKALAVAPDSPYLRYGTEIARHHHERYDGKGYPDGLSGEQIPLVARIVAVADVYDALTSVRPYKKPWPREKVTAYLSEESGRQFDPAVIAATLRVLEERRYTPVFSWSEAMSVGDAALDRDHRILFGLVNQMALPANRGDRVVQEFVLDELLGYAVGHFQREEEHMRKLGFVGLLAHQAVHRRLTEDLLAIRKRFLDGEVNIGEEVWVFLANWLCNHIMSEDQQYNSPAGRE